MSVGLSPAFRSALDALIKLHIQEVAQAVAQADPSTDIAESNVLHNSTLGESALYNDSSYTTFLSHQLPVTNEEQVAVNEGGGNVTQMFHTLEDKLLTKTHIGGQGLAARIAIFGDVKKSMGDGTRIDEFEYDVSMFYHRKGCFQAIARSKTFGLLTLFVVLCNAVFMGIMAEAYHREDTDADTGAAFEMRLNELNVIREFFCTYFLLEWLCRFLAFEKKRNCLRDAWFVCDSLLVTVNVLETYILLSIKGRTKWLRVMRLMRLPRMIRLFHAIPELATLVKAICVAMRAVLAALTLQLLFIYAWAIALFALLGDKEELSYFWGSLRSSMMTLVTTGMMGDDIRSVMQDLTYHTEAFVLFVGFVFISTITLTNMLTGMLCEIISEVATAEKEYEALSRLKADMLLTLKRLDTAGTGEIGKNKFLQLVNDEKGQIVLQELGIDVTLLVELCDMVYDKSATDSLSIEDVMQILLDAQGDRRPSFRDIVLLLGFTRWSLQKDLRVLTDELLAGYSRALRTVGQHRQSAFDGVTPCASRVIVI